MPISRPCPRHSSGPQPHMKVRAAALWLRRAGVFGIKLMPALLHFALGPLARIAIALLEQAHKSVPAPRDTVQVVVGQLAPPLFDAAAELLPLALENIVVHRGLLCCR